MGEDPANTADSGIGGDGSQDGEADGADGADGDPGPTDGDADGSADCKTSCEPGECGFISDGCGDVIECADSCPDGQGCGWDPDKPSQCAFPPSTCAPLTALEACAGRCGAVSDGCSDTILCDASNGGVACEANEVCGGYAGNLQPNVCVPRPTCQPTTCAALGFTCGSASDGCGGVLDCTANTGGCAPGEACGTGAQSNTCVPAPGCTPLSAATACAGTCGQTGDGCGGLIDCEANAGTACPSGTTCGGGGVTGQCGNGGGANGCTRLDPVAECAGKCGFVSDGCGGSYRCADHGGEVCNPNAGESCGGGGVPGECGKPSCTPKTEAQACPAVGGFESCGRVSDGCGGLIDCGGCDANQLCGINQHNVCGPLPVCQPTPITTACAGKCGVVADGCGGSYTCTGSNGGITCSGGQFCGANAPNQCGVPPSTCTPKTCQQLGHSCGLASDGCGQVINCWPGCSPSDASCTGACGEAQGCLAQTDGGPQSCVQGTGGCVGPLCNTAPSCPSGQVTRLTGTVRTPGRAQNGTTINRIPVPNAVVYIPANPGVALPSIFEGVQANNAASCGRCEDEKLVADGQSILASAVTDYKGEFTLEGRIPVGTPFQLVVKVGKWRRVVQVPAGVSQACTSATLSDTYTRLAANTTDGLTGTRLPKIAISTGEVDEMECVFRNIGISESEFTVPASSGRVHMYRANGARMATEVCTGTYAATDNNGSCGCNIGTPSCWFTSCGDYNGNRSGCQGASCVWTPSQLSCAANNNQGCTQGFSGCSWQQADNSVADTTLWSDQATLNRYDMILFDCEGEEVFEDAAPRSRIVNYVNAGGRMFASHFSYTWIEGNGTLAQSAAWGASGTADTDTGFVSLPTGTTARTGANPIKGPLFRDWLDWQGALTGTTAGQLTRPATPQFPITDPRDRAGATVGAATDEWVYRNSSGAKVQQLSFNTPYNAASSAICGRVAYSGFHVAATDNSGNNAYFPGVCSNGELSAQEKVLVFMLFDLAACVSEGEPPTPPQCTPKTAADCRADQCGYISDGCGGVVDCAGCDGGFYCDGNLCKPQECTPADCASLGFTCGLHADGCGGFARDGSGAEGCGTCSDNQVCGLAGPGLCGSPSCIPIPLDTACPANWCGLVSDGCGGTYDCGACPDGQVCGGAGPNQCGEGSCLPIPPATACAGFDCGPVSDGCGGVVNCGECTLPDTCGGGGQHNVCGHPDCTPRGAADACDGLECGWVSDGCGGAIDCGDCPDGRICGGAGPNLCGAACPPTSCAAENAECGKIGDDCGGILDCGPCPPNEVCGAAGPNRCGGGTCTPRTCAQAGAECGRIGDGCGNVVDCGVCTVPGESCGGAGVPNQCDPGTGGCTPTTCEAQNVECGAAGDGCGGLLDCGGCDPGYQCIAGSCEQILM